MYETQYLQLKRIVRPSTNNNNSKGTVEYVNKHIDLLLKAISYTEHNIHSLKTLTSTEQTI